MTAASCSGGKEEGEGEESRGIMPNNTAHIQKKFHQFEQQGWPKTYFNMREAAFKQEERLKLKSKDARLMSNSKLNRYRDVLPYDDSRVRLCKEKNYINASLIPVAKAQRRYILTQGPLEETAGDFWEMVWEQNTHVVVMLNRCIEKQQIKCYQYFPVEESSAMDFGNGFTVELVESTKKKNFIIRQLLLREDPEENDHMDTQKANKENVRKVLHFQFTTWPDFGVPAQTSDFLEFLLEVRNSTLLDSNIYGPAVIHCSAGIGRSGTFIIVDSILVLASLDVSTEEELDINALTLELRKYRMGLIQTSDQLTFTWNAVLDALTDPQWVPLLERSCYAVGCETPPPFSRSMGNKLQSGDHSLSVDQRSVPSSPRKRAHVQSSSFNQFPGTEGGGAEEPSEWAEAEEPRHKQSTAPDFYKADIKKDAKTDQDGGSLRRQRKEAMEQRLAEIRRKMRYTEATSSWHYYLGYGALAAAISGILAYYVWHG